jgi:hypothetical protein
MPKKPEPKIALEVRFDAAATPARVAATANFVDRLLRAADPHLPADSVTLVVSNYSTVAGLRAWTPAGVKVLQQCERFLRSPTREVKRNPETRRMAAAMADATPALVPFHARVAKPRAKKPLAILNEKFVTTSGRLAVPPTANQDEEPPVTGPTEIYSPIYRVGRLDEGKEMMARIRIDAKPYDVPLAANAVGPAFDAARDGIVVPIQIAGGWYRDAHNGLVLDRERARITSVGSTWRPISGAEFLDAIHKELPNVFDDLSDVLPGDMH